MTEALSAVQSRIGQIEDLIRDLGGRTGATGATGTTRGATGSSSTALSSTAGGSGTAGAGFADLLAQVGATTSGATTGTSGEQVIAVARRYLGVNYRWGGTDPRTGLDCSGLTQLVYRQVGVNLPRTSGEQARTGTAVASMAAARPGDLVFFGSPVHHVGIYVGDGKMLDAPRRGKPVQIREVYETPSAIRRVLPDGASPNASSLGALTSASGLSGATALSAAGSGAATGANGSVVGMAGLATLAALRGGGASPTSAPSGGAASGRLAGTPYADLFASAGQRYGLDPALLSAVAGAESGYRPDAVSPAGARVLMQLMPATARELGVDPDQPAQAVDGAARLLSDNRRSFNGRVDLALAAYNAGPAAVRRYGGVPPYAETRAYVERVTKNWGDLR